MNVQFQSLIERGLGMVQLINVFVIVTIVVLFIIGFFIKGNEEKENNFSKRINKHFLHK